MYVHADHLGSVDALTDAGGGVVEHRSYDAFGQRRNPQWGEPPPPSFTSKTTLGFTGHESDGELGLVNMKGRVFDPKLGRFLTTDPIVSDLSFGQSFNPYSYVLNNPLTYVDPSGFEGEPPADQPLKPGPDGVIDVHVYGEKPPPRPPRDTTEKVGVAVPATDTDTTGNEPPVVDPPETEPPDTEPEPDDWTQNPIVQTVGGFLGGVGLGIVPFAGVGQQVLDETGVLPHGTPEARTGLALGQMLGGTFTMVTGLTGEVVGGAASGTGVGASVGVPVIVVSTALVVGGAANVAAGLRGLTQSLSTGSGAPAASAAKRSAKIWRNAGNRSRASGS